jgi:hypothetical protein
VLLCGPSGPLDLTGVLGLTVAGALSATVVLWPPGRSRAPFLACLALAGADVLLLLLRGGRLAG